MEDGERCKTKNDLVQYLLRNYIVAYLWYIFYYFFLAAFFLDTL